MWCLTWAHKHSYIKVCKLTYLDYITTTLLTTTIPTTTTTTTSLWTHSNLNVLLFYVFLVASENTKMPFSGQQIPSNVRHWDSSRWQKHALLPDVVLENFQTALALEGGVGLLNRHTAVSLKLAVVELWHQHDALLLTVLNSRRTFFVHIHKASLTK